MELSGKMAEARLFGLSNSQDKSFTRELAAVIIDKSIDEIFCLIWFIASLSSKQP